MLPKTFIAATTKGIITMNNKMPIQDPSVNGSTYAFQFRASAGFLINICWLSGVIPGRKSTTELLALVTVRSAGAISISLFSNNPIIYISI